MENLERELLNYKAVGKFLADLKEELEEKDNEIVKVAESKRIKQKSKIMDKFMQKFKRVARESIDEERLLIKEFKQGMNRTIQ